jgi:ADP-ribosylglycohydrolase
MHNISERPLYGCSGPAGKRSLRRTALFVKPRDTLDMTMCNPCVTEAADRLGNGIEAHHSVPLALYAFLENLRSFPDCLLYAIRAGGDTDTIASMAGALSGAYLGEDAIPSSWKLRMEAADYLCRLADSIFDLTGEKRAL